MQEEAHMGKTVLKYAAGTLVGTFMVMYTVNKLFSREIRTTQPEWVRHAYEDKILDARKIAEGDADRLARREAFKNKAASN
jgi:hypothetical protein